MNNNTSLNSFGFSKSRLERKGSFASNKTSIFFRIGSGESTLQFFILPIKSIARLKSIRKGKFEMEYFFISKDGF
ncbi:hypothetical protein CH380_10440 [Leptospira adleri]|uniref:Uncharacterized protein n=1 Tax=Leptospira adleri TaxID=2023186 RepID=A0A2M9YP10_9LEPT|nr:hypothetical protein CH380_10440 [Leptospira adleri]PJZ63972.1 hypothetical protein CH376_00670 [Leptospira adleri]